MRHHVEHSDIPGPSRMVAGVVAALGLFTIGLPYMTQTPGIAFWNDAIVGALLAALGAAGAWTGARWPNVVAATLGLWLLVSAALLPSSAPHAVGEAVVGLLVLGFAGFNAWLAPRPVRAPGGRPGV